MRDRPPTPPHPSGAPLLAAAAALATAAGVWLLSQTVARDIQHPDYSSLNDRPQGTRLLFDALSRTSRDTRRLFELRDLPADQTTLLRVGQSLDVYSLSQLTATPEATSFVLGGGRLACAFRGAQPSRTRPYRPPSEAATNTPFAAPDSPSTNPAAKAAWTLLSGVRIHLLTNLTAAARTETAEDSAPWLSAATFRLDEQAARHWRPLYTLDGHPVLIEARFGRGSVALATDAYFLSNEALANDRHTALLSAFLGPARTVLFDETVHGLHETRNTAWLMRRYRLHLPLATAALLFLLTLWQHATPLLPRQRRPSADQHRRGFRMEDGLVSLIHRHLPPSRLPRLLLDAWCATATRADPETRSRMRQLVEDDEKRRAPPAETCRALHWLAQPQRRRSAAQAAATTPPADTGA